MLKLQRPRSASANRIDSKKVAKMKKKIKLVAQNSEPIPTVPETRRSDPPAPAPPAANSVDPFDFEPLNFTSTVYTGVKNKKKKSPRKGARPRSESAEPFGRANPGAIPDRPAGYYNPVVNPFQVKKKQARSKSSAHAFGRPLNLDAMGGEDKKENGASTGSARKPKARKKKSKSGHKIDILPLMHQGMKMYKFGKKLTKPRQRTVYLSRDNRYLKWASPFKKADETQVEVASISRVDHGEKSDVYNQARELAADGVVKPSLAITVHYEATSGKQKTLNLLAILPLHHMIWVEGLTRLNKVCKSGADPGNVIELFQSVSRDSRASLEQEFSNVSTTSKKDTKNKFRWEKISLANAEEQKRRAASPRGQRPVEITTASGRVRSPRSFSASQGTAVATASASSPQNASGGSFKGWV